MRLTWPSTAPELQGRLSPLVTASWSPKTSSAISASYAPPTESRPAFSLTVHAAYKDKRARLSSICAAYLAGFAALG